MSSYSQRRRKINAEISNYMNLIESESCTHRVTANLEVDILVSNEISETNDCINDEDPPNVVESQVTPNLECNLNTEGSYELSNKLGKWSLDFSVTHRAVDSLLKILKPVCGDRVLLPNCSKTLLKTPRKLNTVSLGNGKYYYFGITDKLVREISMGLTNFQFPMMKRTLIKNLITLRISTDGLPIFKSTGMQMWPILYIIDQSKNPVPHVAAIFCGESKPMYINEFFGKLIEEVSRLETNGVFVNGVHYSVKISCIIADAPARSFLKAIKGHNGHHACERCIDEGDYSNFRMLYSDQSKLLRTDISFLKQEDSDHHVGLSPFCELNIGLVTQVVLDYMHLVCLGIMRKLIHYWTDGAPNKRVKLPSRIVTGISNYLQSIKNLVPIEFSRKPRGLKDLNRFKATEYRQILLYTGLTCFAGSISTQMYKHFLLLNCAFRILLSDKACSLEWNTCAKRLLEKFVKYMPIIYGNCSLIYNVHNLLHIADDALNFGNLNNVNAFPFENFLGSTKRLIQAKSFPLEQVVKRLLERENLEKDHSNQKVTTEVLKCGIKIKNFILKPFVASKFILSKHSRDSVFLSVLGNVNVLVNVLVENNEIYLNCKEFLTKSPLHEYPIVSSRLNVFNVLVTSLSSRTSKITVNDFKSKCVVLPDKNVKLNCICVGM